MKIKILNDNTIRIKGNIRTLEHFDDIKESILSTISHSTQAINIEIIKSFALPSSYIFLLLDLQQKYKIDINISVSDIRLYEILIKLNLENRFLIKRINEPN